MDDEMDVMTARAASKMPKDHPIKKSSGTQTKKNREGKNAFYKISEYSLARSLDDEPDIYSLADLKVRYR